MLPDYLVEGLESLEVSRKDWKAVLASRETRAMKAVLKTCLAGVFEAEGHLFSEQALSDSQKERYIGARNALYRLADLIAAPPIDDDEEVEENE